MIAAPSSTYTRLTSVPSAPVCGVTRRWPIRASAAAATASTDRATLMPPALPRPPACTCAFTAQTPPPSVSAAARASAAV